MNVPNATRRLFEQWKTTRHAIGFDTEEKVAKSEEIADKMGVRLIRRDSPLPQLPLQRQSQGVTNCARFRVSPVSPAMAPPRSGSRFMATTVARISTDRLRRRSIETSESRPSKLPG